MPSGSNIKLLIESNLLHASIAAEPVSPEVAPSTIAVFPCFVRLLLKKAAANWSPKSLKAAVGPWNSSKTNLLSSSSLIAAKSL